MSFLCRMRGIPAIAAVLLLSNFLKSALATCSNSENQLCIVPSMGPTGGGTNIVVGGLQSSSIAGGFITSCIAAQSWTCFFVLGGDQRFSSSGSASINDCNAGQIQCSSPSVTQPNDYLFFIVGAFLVSGKVTHATFPTGGSLPQFSYFAIQTISPISGTVGFKTAVEVQFFNAKSLDAFVCRFIPRWYVSSWEQVGWSSSMSFSATTVVEDVIDGQLRQGIYPIPDDRPAGFVEDNIIECTIPDDLVLDASSANATLWLEVAEQASPSGIANPVFTRQRRRFIVYKAPNMTSASVRAAPYTGGSVITVSGKFFDSLGRTDTQASAGGLKCRFLWCFDYTQEITCKTTPFLTGDFINSTSAVCKTAQYYPGDPDCDTQVFSSLLFLLSLCPDGRFSYMQCRPGGPDAGYRLIEAVSNLQYRKNLYLECCGDTCCSEEVQVQLALNGVEFIPSMDSRYPQYTWVQTNSRVLITMYAALVLTGIYPPAVPLQGASVTVYGLNFISASKNYTSNARFCIFGRYIQTASSLVWSRVPIQFISDSEVICSVPPSIRSIRATVFMTFNGLDSQSSDYVSLAYYSISRVDPNFGGFLGGSFLNISGPFLDLLEGYGGTYSCKFTGSSTALTVPATLDAQGSLTCISPSGTIGNVLVSISLDGVSYSQDNPPVYFKYVEESLANIADPNVGPQVGGFLVRIFGSYFVNSSLLACRFKAAGLDITVRGGDVSFLSSTSVVCLAPPASVSGLVSVYVLNNGQQGSLTFAKLTYFSILYVAPDGGLVSGGANVTVTLSTNVSSGWCRFGSEVVAATRTGIGSTLYCLTTGTMSTSAIGSEVPFAISLNNRDFASSSFFQNFTFYLHPNVVQLIPESGPQRGNTIVTVRGNGFFSLCRTGQSPTGDCYKCSQAASNTFTWSSLSSCAVPSLKIQSIRPCGLPCQPGFDDRLSFGLTGDIYCRFGKITVLAKYKTPSQMLCVSPPTTNVTVAVRSSVEVSFNDLQFSESGVLFSYYEITGVTPSSGPTYGDTVISIEGQNLFAASQIACLFWINIVKQGLYDADNDVILCPTPEQPIELRDNDVILIQFKVSLNSLIADQYTTTLLSFQYYEDAILRDMSVVMGPMNAKFLIYLKLPFSRTPTIDYLHQSSPYQYSHVFSQTFLNASSQTEQPAVCFGRIVVSYSSSLGIQQTCCDDEETDKPCDGYSRGLVSLGEYKNASFLAVSSPDPQYAVTGDVEIAWNGFIRQPYSSKFSGLVYNPTAQYTRRAYCQPNLFVCMQDDLGQRCEVNTDCDGLTFRFWAIYSIFPVAASVKGATDLDLIGDNFPYPSDDPGSRCVFFRYPSCNNNGTLDRACNLPIEFSRTVLNPVQDDCDACTSFDPGGNCLTVRFCRSIRCKTPPAPNGIVQEIVVEVLYTGYPLSNYRFQPNPVSKLFYYLEVKIFSLDISAGPDNGGTQLLINGSGFVNSPSLFCQFAVATTNTFSKTLLWSPAIYISPTTLNCTVPACTQLAISVINSSSCGSCANCDLFLFVTVNSRDFATGSLPFWYRSAPDPLSLYPKRAPFQSQVRQAVTISGVNFPNVGSQNTQRFGLSCRFGMIQVKGIFDATCNNTKFCDKIDCIPPFSTQNGPVEVAVSIDGQQYIAIPGNGSGGFSFYSITDVLPPLFPSQESVNMIVNGVQLNDGVNYMCRFTSVLTTANVSNVTIYSNGTFLYTDTGKPAVMCPVPPPGFPTGIFGVALSLDGLDSPEQSRDYTTDPIFINVFQQCEVTDLSPTKGRRLGGIIVTVRGRNFRNTTLLTCLFGNVRGPKAEFVNDSMVRCTMPSISGEDNVFLEVSFNGQDFSHSATTFAVYAVPRVFSITPASLPVACSKSALITGLYFRNFSSFQCRFWDLLASKNLSAPVQYINASAVICQVPPCKDASDPCTYVVLVTVDGVEFSRDSIFLRFYQLAALSPIDGPIYGGTPISIQGQNLNHGARYKCRFLARDGLDLENSILNSVYGAVINRAGYGYADGTYELIQTSCSDTLNTVFSIIPADDIISSEDYGIHYLSVNCTAPCNGSGLLATYTNLPDQIPVIEILDAGRQYCPNYPPTLSANNGKWRFTPRIGTNCLMPGCCLSGLAGTYTVYNGSIVTITIPNGGMNFSADNAPAFGPNGCDGYGNGSGCKMCYYARYIPNGSCAGICQCDGDLPTCSSRSTAAACTCTKPLNGAPCTLDADCEESGACVHSGMIHLLVANMTNSEGRYDNRSEVMICRAPPVTFPSLLYSFRSYLGYPWNGVPANLKGLAPLLLKVSIHNGPEYTTRSLIFRYLDPPIVTNVTPNSASSRGGTYITVTGSSFRKEEGMSTYIEEDITRADSYGPTDGNMKMTCRLHDDLPLMPGRFVNTTSVICITNRVCFQDSTMSDCSGCITEGCAAPNSSIFATDAFMGAGISMNEYDFEDGGIPFYVYSITSFRPFGGVYDGGTHVTISGIGFDRGGSGPYDAHCKFSRIIVPATYQPELGTITCISGPLLDVLTVLEIHLGGELDDSTLYTDNGQIFYYYTAYPGGLTIVPNSGTFRGNEPITFQVPQAELYNIFRFRALDFSCELRGITAVVLILGSRDDDPGILAKLEFFRSLILSTWLSIEPSSLVQLSDIFLGDRISVNDTAFTLAFRVEPVENATSALSTLQEILTLPAFGIAFLTKAQLYCLNPGDFVSYTFFSDYGAFAKFGTTITPASVSSQTALQGTTPLISAQTSSSTVPIYFSMNGQQFSLQPLDFYFYSVSSVAPFGVPFTYGISPGTTTIDLKQWIACPDNGNLCPYTVVESIAAVTVTVYGNNFQTGASQVGDDINIQCLFGDVTDTQNGIIGIQLDPLDTGGRLTAGTLYADEGYVLCQQPSSLALRSLYDDSYSTRRIRVEVSLNGRDFSYSFLSLTAGAGIVLYKEPQILVDGLSPYSPDVSPIQGGSVVTVNGNNFRTDASPETCFCLFSEQAVSSGYENWMKTPATVESTTSILCLTPPFSDFGYGYAASTFSTPPQDIIIYVTMNNFHWHRIPDLTHTFSFFDILKVSPTMSSAEYTSGTDANLAFSPGNFLNPDELTPYCWWDVPGSVQPANAFVVQGLRTAGSQYLCAIPDWSLININGQVATNVLPCNQSFIAGTTATCNFADGRLTVRFGIAFLDSFDPSRKQEFSFGTEFSFYSQPKFQDFLPKMGDQNGGTDIHIYGENFLDVPTLGCKFSEGVTAVLGTVAIYVNSSHVICVSPQRNIKSTVNLYLTLNGVTWYTCLNTDPSCTLAHPYYGGAITSCCAWQNSISQTQERLVSYSYAARPTVSSLLPDAAPTRGDTNINVIGNNIVGNVQGSAFACLVGSEKIRGAFVTNGGLQYLTCLTQPNMEVGDLNLFVSLNGFEWSDNFQVLHVFNPLRAFRIVPSFTVWDNPINTVTVVGINFIIPAEQVGSMLIRLVEYDASGIVRWKKDVPPIAYGNELADVNAPSLAGGIVVDVMTFKPPKRDPCTTPTARFCEPGVVNVYVSQNEGTEWTWENVTFAYVRTPTDKTRCYLDYPVSSVNGWCGVEAIAIVTNGIWDVEADPQVWKNLARTELTNDRGECTLANASDFFGQSVTTGKCACTAGDCRINAYDCGDKQAGALYLGCSIKAAITQIIPRSGPQAGGTMVTVRGFKLNKGNVYWCKFGAQVITASFNATDALIRCRTPASEMNGSVEVEVSISNTEEWTDSHGLFTFHYYFPPTIMGLEPSLGPASGGTNVIVTAGYTDSMFALGTLWRSLDVDQYGIPTCRLPLLNGLCAGMNTFGSYTDYGPITPGLENYCVWEPHCRFQLYQQQRLACEFSDEVHGFSGFSVEAIYLSRNVIQCTTPTYDLLMHASNGITSLNVSVRVTIDGQLWFDSPVTFLYYAFTNITTLLPEVGPAEGGVWVSLIGTGFIYSDLAICFFGSKPALRYQYVSSTVVMCQSPPSGELQQVPVGLALNSLQVAMAAELFEYVAGVSVVNLFPRLGQEIGGTLVTVVGLNFINSKILSCKFGSIVVEKPKATFISSSTIRCKAPRSILSRYPWETNKSYSGFVTNPILCVGHLIPGTTKRIDAGWTVCANCTDCCQCLDCPECKTVLPTCACDETHVFPCPPNPPVPERAARSLCLPPEFRCYWAPRIDPTFSQLQCDLLNFTGQVLTSPQPVELILQEGQYLHPDLALRQTIPFYVSLDGQTWISGCVQNPQYGVPPGTKFSKGEETCLTNDPSGDDKWTGTFTFAEKYNTTRFKPDIATVNGGTIITIVGEGFQNTNDIRCKFGYKSLPDFFDSENPCDAQGNLTGIVLNEVPGTFVDSFTVLCISPAVDLLVHRIGNPPVLANGLINDPVCAPYSKNPSYVIVPTEITINGNAADYALEVIPFYYAKPWQITELSPSKSPTIGGTYITITGPYFRNTEDILCKFGDLHATSVQWINANTVICRTPSVKIHQYVNVSITLDGQYWSEASNTSIFEFDGVRNLMMFGENDYGQLGFGVSGPRLFSGFRCVDGQTQDFPCTTNADCPSGTCKFSNQTNLNLEPTFLDTLFAHNITGIAMGQTHTLIISSQTYNDTLNTVPRRGVVYSWGGNLVGQLGLGFSGVSLQYDLTEPSVLVCQSEDIYILDVRLDNRPIVGLPSNFPTSTFYIPTCVKKQDVYSQGVWYVDTILVYNPFYYDEVVQVAAGSFHSLALTQSGNLYSWGWNNDGQLGLGPLQVQTSIPYPTLIFYFLQKNPIQIAKISAGFAHSAAVSSNGILYMWGNNKYGQLAQGDYESRSFPTAVERFQDSGGANLLVADVKCGLYHCLILTTQGQVWSFGSNSRGQLGTCATPAALNNDRDFVCQASPIEVGAIVYTSPVLRKVEFPNVTDALANILGAPRAVQIATGAFHSLAITVPCAAPLGDYNDPCPSYDYYTSDLYIWGNNKYGQLGLGTNSDGEYRALPMLIPALFTVSSQCNTAEDVVCVAGQYTDGCCHPGSDYEQLGVVVKGIGAGSWHTIFYVEQHEAIGYSKSLFPVERMYSMGNNDEGQLGLGDTVLRNLPTEIKSNFVEFHDVGGGYFQSLFTLGCPPGDDNVCNGNGLCYEQGICDCYPGFRGSDCSIQCDGTAERVCSLHGNASVGYEMAAWRRTMIQAASGRRMKARMDAMFTRFRCTYSNSSLFDSLANCTTYCKKANGNCVVITAASVSSADVMKFLNQVVRDYPIMITAVNLIIADWPLRLFLQGVTQWRYSYEARAAVLSASTIGPSSGRWQVQDIIPIVQMLQDRATCWRTYNCPNGMCQILRGETRTIPSGSGLEAGAGCRDGWTARIAFRSQIENLDRVWANLEIENQYCDPQQVADLYGLQKEQVQFIWSTLDSDFANATATLLAQKDQVLSTPFTSGGDPVATVEKVWTALDQLCYAVTISDAREGCLIDGACVCEKGWTGIACDVPCNGGVNSPCALHGICRDDGQCDCDRGWTGPTCSVECDGAKDNPGHFPCNLHGSCNGWYVDPVSMYDDGPPDFDTALYYSAAKGVSVWYMGTSLAANGSCRCYYGFRNPDGQADCSVECPGTPDTFLSEYGECYDNGACNGTGSCQCYDGYRNVSCNVECLGSHKHDVYTGLPFSNECTAQPVCDVYPDYVITTISGGTTLCKDQNPFSDSYSKDYKVSASGQILRVFNGLCQYNDLNPRDVARQYPIPDCPGPEWCHPDFPVAGPGGACKSDAAYCVEYLTRTKNYTGQPWSSALPEHDPILGPPPAGCPSVECQQIPLYMQEEGYNLTDLRFRWHAASSDVLVHHSAVMGRCYCLPGFRGSDCSLKCPGGYYGQQNEAGLKRLFPTSLKRTANDSDIYGTDKLRGWDTNDDGVPDGVAGRSLVNICTGNGYCEEDATCSCFLTDIGPHTNYTRVSGWRGEACEIPCEGGPYSICSRHGICDDGGNCTCFKGYRNYSCDIECKGVRDCDPSHGCQGVCNYAGECGDDGTCICDYAYRGPACELICPPWDGVVSSICSGPSHGHCDESAKCVCVPIYEGDNCQNLAAWLIFLIVLFFLILTFAAVHIIRRYMHARLRQKRRARRERRKVKRTQAAVGRLRTYTVAAPDASSLEAKGLQ